MSKRPLAVKAFLLLTLSFSLPATARWDHGAGTIHFVGAHWNNDGNWVVIRNDQGVFKHCWADKADSHLFMVALTAAGTAKRVRYWCDTETQRHTGLRLHRLDIYK